MSNRTTRQIDAHWPMYQGQNVRTTEVKTREPSTKSAYPDITHTNWTRYTGTMIPLNGSHAVKNVGIKTQATNTTQGPPKHSQTPSGNKATHRMGRIVTKITPTCHNTGLAFPTHKLTTSKTMPAFQWHPLALFGIRIIFHGGNRNATTTKRK